MSTADRFDSGKPQLHYTDSFSVAQDGVAYVAMAGAEKYSPFNYKKGAKSSLESYDCARRHMKAWYNGEDFVPDVPDKYKGKIHHIDAAIWNLMRLRQELVDFPERDTRPHLILARENSPVVMDTKQLEFDWGSKK